ncbi:hypothetical protein ISN44_As04g041270 [Arabidopsis suecica]|uniref:Nucleolar-like protein n=2 Tax=Arabidopsis TaxID=3701 RepID=A0A5S9Y0B7_ARATH|nr:hypothetical protein ISN44_As04g041270 [Arabidopsis suecica]CAA0397983.1 unnamed protein product [Arabidopsis thaliana]
MDSFSTQKPKSRKMKKRLAKKSRVEIILDLFFRAIEIVVVLVTLAKLSYELVVTFEDSSVASVILANRSLAFVIGNAIVIALIAKSGILLNQEHDPKCKSNDLYEDFVLESSRRGGFSQDEMRSGEKQSEAENEAKQSITENKAKENEEKQSITESRVKKSVTEKKTKRIISEKKVKQSKPEKLTKQSTFVNREKQSEVEHKDITMTIEKQNLTEKRQIQSYQRSKSENLKVLEKSYCGRLKRSETDASAERVDSDDELRYKIESFIARQRRNQTDE